ncbi:Copper resistance protein B [Dissulfuribacter thermophilus]|uniref:Copper resistance protein B n=1 Tax=Dissulfuribacter thermophilus TaxID=1156395 RepID=A0A1B9F7B5_9BACT|nr:copper resistance protein B [Dissulfuribacter thermophilus]OCC15848.1 Copper resistance protein B [Dissulfuribacter thermophilus]
MIKKVLFFTIFLASLAHASENKNCETYPVSPMPALHYGKVLIDRLEYTFDGKKKKNLDYEVTAWYGGDYQRLWLEAEGQHDTGSGQGGELERIDLLYGKLISPFWDLRLGAGFRGSYGADTQNRTFGVIGLKGLAPYFFEIDSNLKISNKGEIIWDLEAEYDILFSQRLILQPRLDTSFAFNPIEELGIGSGINNINIGLRLRYEFKREFAPYIGANWSTKIGSSRDLAKSEGEPPDVTQVYIGVKFWF